MIGRVFAAGIATALALAAWAPAAPAQGLNPGFVIAPSSQDFGKHRIGTTTKRVFHVRGRTCAEIDPARPNCEDMIFPAIAFRPPSASGDFEVIRHNCGTFGVASPSGDPCTMTVAFRPTKVGLRKGDLGGVAALRGKGLKPKSKRRGGPRAGG